MTTIQRRVDFIPARTYKTPDCFASLAGAQAPTLVVIHGISRNAAEMAARFASHPAYRGVNIIAPLFERRRFGQYQQLLTRRAQETPADNALFALLDQLGEDKGISVDKVLLFGFSGGAQMAHRLAMLYPHRVERLCAAAAGWYMLPDPYLPYPYGLGAAGSKPAPRADFLDVPTTVIVGERDTRVDESVRQDPMIVARQGRDRLERGRTWVQKMAEHAKAMDRHPNVQMVTLENAAHDFGQCARVAGLLDCTARALLH